MGIYKWNPNVSRTAKTRGKVKMSTESNVVVIREEEYHLLLALADPITQREAQKYSTTLTHRYASKIKDFLWWYD